MENLNTNTEYKPSYDTIKQQQDHFEERLKIERRKAGSFLKINLRRFSIQLLKVNLTILKRILRKRFTNWKAVLMISTLSSISAIWFALR